MFSVRKFGDAENATGRQRSRIGKEAFEVTQPRNDAVR